VIFVSSVLSLCTQRVTAETLLAALHLIGTPHFTAALPALMHVANHNGIQTTKLSATIVYR